MPIKWAGIKALLKLTIAPGAGIKGTTTSPARNSGGHIDTIKNMTIKIRIKTYSFLIIKTNNLTFFNTIAFR